ncbi:MAG TPA: ArsR family transcriptional regulator [candidate division WWE3 bacterium]|uniref:ArsR family transcriptional regulator n=1 Tax=candidate division WWE3 bacterium TaxID=2053526 RepID=A0A7C1DI48_UNCKA|nr:ArsR family transcriptional regulator [candidate division WWE3 bacterium]
MLKKFFISEVRIALLKLMLLHPDEQHHVRSIVREVGAEINAVRRELSRLEKVGLLTKRKSSNRVYYRVNTDHIYYSDLLSMVAKDCGLGKDIIEHTKQLGDVKFAMIAKPFLTGRVSTVLDVDLFVVGHPDMTLLKVLVTRAESDKSKEINYSVMTLEEFNHRKRSNDAFINRLLAQGRAMLIGNEEKFSSI